MAALARGESLYEYDESALDEVDSVDDAGRVTERHVKQLPPAGASGGPGVNDYYVPAKAFDGNQRTWWTGFVDAKKWDLYYGFRNPHFIETLNLNFYNQDYIPQKVNVYMSADGVKWTRVAKLKNKKGQTFNPDVAVQSDAQYIWIEMQGNPRSGFPIIRDIGWTPFVEHPGAFATPGANDSYYFASNMFDGNTATQWAGAVNAGAWDIYYGFAQPRFVGVIKIDLFNINYRPAETTLLVSRDGVAWENLGSFGTVWPQAMFVGREIQSFKIEMRGNPISGSPNIREITYDLPAGAFATPNEKPLSWPAANAFDNTPSTWWVGKSYAGEWNVFYGFENPASVGTVTIRYYSVNHTPQTTKLFTSEDGVTWTPSGTFPAGAAPSVTLNDTVRYLRFAMQGNPTVGYPLVRDIVW